MVAPNCDISVSFYQLHLAKLCVHLGSQFISSLLKISDNTVNIFPIFDPSSSTKFLSLTESGKYKTIVKSQNVKYRWYQKLMIYLVIVFEIWHSEILNQKMQVFSRFSFSNAIMIFLMEITITNCFIHFFFYFILGGGQR